MALNVCDSVKRVDVTISNSSFQTLCDGALEVLKHTEKNWDPVTVKFKLFTDGITNHLLGCYTSVDPRDIILVRVYGKKTELFIDHNAEVRNMNIVHRAGLGCPIYCAFNNGLCYGYFPGMTLDAKTVRDPFISRRVAELMASLHSIKQPTKDYVEPKPSLFRTMRRFWELSPTSFKEEQKDKRFKQRIANKSNLKREIDILEDQISRMGSPTVFCHNDILLKNIIYNKDKGSVSFIDYEYSDFNYQAFDIGNHFCEFAGVEKFNPELYPERDFQLYWIENYLQAWYAKHDQTKEVTYNDIELLYVQVNKCALAAHLFWGLWALVQAEHSSLEFDYLGYAISRMDEYFSRKEEFLGLELPEAEINSNNLIIRCTH